MIELPSLALTLIQPWGSLIMLTEDLRKDLENRTWAPSPNQLRAGNRLWIHAGKKLDTDTLFVYDNLLPFTEADIPRGALLGHVRFDGVTHRENASPWFMGPIGWLLSDPVPLSKPIPCKGAQGLWRVPSDVLEIVHVDLEGRTPPPSACEPSIEGARGLDANDHAAAVASSATKSPGSGYGSRHERRAAEKLFRTNRGRR